MIKLSKVKGEFIMKKFHGLVLTAVLTSLIIPFSLAASAETNENGNNATPTEEKTTDTTKNIMTEKKTEPVEPTKDTTAKKQSTNNDRYYGLTRSLLLRTK